MKKKIIIIVTIILVIILLIVGMYFFSLGSISKKSEEVTFNIYSGTSTREVVNNLYDAKLIRSRIATLVYLKTHPKIIVQAGTYKLNRNFNVKEIFSSFNRGNTVDNTVKLTFIEGKRLIDYVKVISDKMGYSESDILNKLNDQEYLKELINEYDFLDEKILNSDIYYPLEGYLFPSTYEVYKDAKIEDIIAKMLAKTKNVLDNYSALIEGSNYSIHEILTMASIIENETISKEDKDIVSQVIYKRLSINMSLGMDVTTYYGVRKALGEDLTTVDLNSKNAYNTRNTSFLGLPVGPICNPSEDAIKAALNPSDTNYIYFYADKSGKLHFANTYEEFTELKRMYS